MEFRADGDSLPKTELESNEDCRNQLEAAVNLQSFFTLMFNLMPFDFSVHKSRSNPLGKQDAVWHIGVLNTSQWHSNALYQWALAWKKIAR